MTFFAPWVLNIPILIIFSLTIRGALDTPGSAMAFESFQWIKALGQGDMALAMIGGGVGLIQVEFIEARQKASAEGTASDADGSQSDGEQLDETSADTSGKRQLPARPPGARSDIKKAPQRTSSPAQPTLTSHQTPRSSASRQAAPPLIQPNASHPAVVGARPKSRQFVDVLYRDLTSKQWSTIQSRAVILLMRAGSMVLICVGPFIPSVSHSHSTFDVVEVI